MVSVLGVIGGVENDSGAEKTFWAHFGGVLRKNVVFLDLHTVNPIVNIFTIGFTVWPKPHCKSYCKFFKNGPRGPGAIWYRL
jgi:hypothetical protein